MPASEAAAQGVSPFPPADSAATANVTVGRVSVAGYEAADSGRILRTCEVATGARDEGYARASIDAQADTVKDGAEVSLTFAIREGEKVKINRVDFVGAKAFQTAKLQKRLKSKPRGFLGGGDVKEEQFNEDKERLEYWYHSNGYRDMRVAGQELVPGSAPNRLVLKVAVEEGPSYDFGKVTWSGNKVLSTP